MCDTKSCNNKLTVKFSKISKHYPLGKGHPAYIEVKINKELNKLVTANITPHINIIFNNIVCKWDVLQNIKFDSMGEWKNVLNHSMFYGESHNKVSINFIDLGYMDFFKYIQSGINYNIFVYLLFQLYYTLACIQYHHPGFKHNDLKCDNILVFKPKTTKTNMFNEYKIYGKVFYLPANCMQLKIMDFDFSSTDAISNLKIEDQGFNKMGLSTSPNPLYDIHFFLNDVYRLIERTPIFNALISSVLPIKYKGTDSNYLKRYRLSSYYKNNKQLKGKDFNYIPKKGDILSPIEMILYGDMFSDIKTTLNSTETIVHSYNAKIKKIKGRKDMLHTYL
jgi:serine/threonine protein kinase